MSGAEPHVLLFDPYLGGHHGQHVAELVRYWLEHDLPGRLDLLLASGFGEMHRDVASLFDAASDDRLRLLDFGDSPHEVSDAVGLARLDLAVGRRLAEQLRAHRPSHVLLLYFDHLQLSLARDLRFDFPIRLSGIYFRPSFHYGSLDGRGRGFADWLRDQRKRLQLAAALRNPHLDTLLCLDPFVVPHLGRHRRVRAIHLPEPLAPARSRQTRESIRQRLGIEPGRSVAALVGSLSERKGVLHVLEAARRLPPDIQPRLCLWFAGAIPRAERPAVTAAAQRLREAGTVQLVVDDRFIDDDEFGSLLAGADFVLAPYQRHVGSSGILVRAAAAGLPVIGSDYGLVGALIARHRLGLAVDATKPEELARALERAVRTPGELGFDAQRAARYAEENTAERFAATVFHAAGVLAA